MNAEDFYKRGLKKAWKLNITGAIADFTKALRLNPNFAEAYHSRAIAYSYQSPKQEYKAIEFKLNALEDYAQALRLNPRNVATYFNRALLREQLQDFAGAIEDLTQALHLEPENAVFYCHRGRLRQNLEVFSRAMEDFTAALQYSSGGQQDAWIYCSRGDVRVEMGDFQEAIADFTQALQIVPDDLKAYYGRGQARAELKDVTGAIEDYTNAIGYASKEKKLGRESDIAAIYVCRGLLYSYRGDKQAAIKDLQKATKLCRQEQGLYSEGISRQKRLLAYIKELQQVS